MRFPDYCGSHVAMKTIVLIAGLLSLSCQDSWAGKEALFLLQAEPEMLPIQTNLPDPLAFAVGAAIRESKGWRAERERLISEFQHYMYGEAPRRPAKPDFRIDSVDPQCLGGKATRKRDERYEYSNLGFGLLGYVLGRAAGSSYADLLQKRVLTPLGLAASWLDVPRSEEARYSHGHYIDGDTLKRARYWRFNVLAGAGALVMSARDIGRYAQAASGAIDTPLRDAFRLTQRKYGDGMAPMNPQGLAWLLAPLNGRTVFNHGGMTGGFTSSLWVDPERKAAIAVLSNAAGATPDDIALHLLEPSIPIRAVVRPQTAVSVDAKTLAQYAGNYRLAPGFDVVVRLRDGRLFAQATGQNEFELFAKSPTAFFARVTELEIVFGEVKDGRAASFALTQGGRTRTAPRID